MVFVLHSARTTRRLLWLVYGLTTALLAVDCPPSNLTPAQTRTRFEEAQARGAKLFQQGEFAKAAEELRAAVCLVPGSASAYQTLGLAEAAAGDFDRALESLDRASRFAPRDFTMLLARAQVEASLGKFDLARRSLLGAAEVEPQDTRNAAIHAQLARQLLQQKQGDLALAELLRFRQRGGADPDTLFLLARLENTLGAYGDAIRDGSRLEKDTALPARLRAAGAAVTGLGYKNLEQPDEAIPHLKQAIELGTDGVAVILETACLALAEIYQMKEDSPAARAALERGRKALPDSTRLAVALGRNLAEAGDRAAVPLLKELIATSPAESEAYRWLAQAYTVLGDFPLATATLSQLARRRPDYPAIDVMIAQAILKEDQPDYPRALEHLDLAEKATPSDADLYYLRGKIFLTLGQYQDAVKALRRAIELAPTAASSYYQLGTAYQRLGQTVLAKEQFDRMTYLRNAGPNGDIVETRRP